jgi:hypothetical protein
MNLRCARVAVFAMCFHMWLTHDLLAVPTHYPSDERELADALQEVTGSGVRIVWCGGLRGDGDEWGICLFDTEDGTARILHRIAKRRPHMVWITRDGERVIYQRVEGDPSDTRARGPCFIVGSDGRGKRELFNGEFQFIGDVWTDLDTDETWVYTVGRRGGRNGRDAVHRYSADRPGVREMVWDKSRVVRSFQLSRDGRYAATHVNANQVSVGIIDLRNERLQIVGAGCEAAIAPDNTYRSYGFLGGHDAIRVYAGKDRESQRVRLNTMEGLNGRGEVGYMRWSNDPEFFTLRAPGSHHQRFGSRKARRSDIYLGRFADDLSTVAEWVRITANDVADHYSHAWIQPAAVAPDKRIPRLMTAERSGAIERPSRAVVPPPVADATPATGVDGLGHASATATAEWPPNRDRLVFGWPNALSGPTVSRDGGMSQQPVLRQRGRALVNRHYGMSLANGYFRIEDLPVDALLTGGRMRSLTLEATLTPAEGGLSGDATILTAELPSGRVLFRLAQRAHRLAFGIQNRGYGFVTVPLCDMSASRSHFALTHDDGELRAYMDGMLVHRAVVPAGDSGVDLSEAVRAVLTFGSADTDPVGWTGDIEGMAIYGRVLSAEEIAEHAALYTQQHVAPVATTRIEVRARLVEKSSSPDVLQGQAYDRALIVCEYEVLDVVAGRFADRRIYVAHWAMLDRETLPIVDRRVGDVVTLIVEPYIAHPQIESELLVDETEHGFEVELFVDVSRP